MRRPPDPARPFGACNLISLIMSLLPFPRPVFRRILPVVGALLLCVAARADDTDTPRQILICSSSQASPGLQKLVSDFKDHASEVPLLAALLNNQEATGVDTRTSEEIMDPKLYRIAAHNHLIVIGLRSQDSLLDKAWGYNATVDEAKKTFYAEGWGYMSGDIGWVESDENPFLHSAKIKSAPQDTYLIKITGTSEAGVAAALRAFRGGMLNGFVAASPLSRPQTTLLDLDPSTNPVPATLPTQIQISDSLAPLAGWYQVPEQEYRAVLEAGGVEPVKMWRYKYLASGLLEQAGTPRFLGGVNRMAYGNAIDIIECHSPDEAAAAAEKMSGISTKDGGFKLITLSNAPNAWESPQQGDENVAAGTWKIIVTSTGPYVIMSSLPAEGTSAVINALASAPSH